MSATAVCARDNDPRVKAARAEHGRKTFGMKFEIHDYHHRELEIALDPNNPSRVMPTILKQHKRILDVGCGMGQTLIALKLPSDVEAVGIDPDTAAIEMGKRLVPPNITLLCASGEKLPFPDASFDLVFCRVSLPYMRIDKALREIRRVLRPGGDVWFTLHPASMTTKKLIIALKQVLLALYVLMNGSLFNLIGFQIPGRRQETFQTPGGIRRALGRAGMYPTRVEIRRHFVVEGSSVDRE